MQVERIEIDRKEARALYRDYKKHRDYDHPIDQECMRAYQLIAQGRMIIQALQAIKASGLNAQGLPNLAICRADNKNVIARLDRDGGGWMTGGTEWRRPERNTIKFPAGFFPSDAKREWGTKFEAMVPVIPAVHRPKRALQNYHVLWEAEWQKVAPVDPYLLRRIGKSDMWLVVAAWDLTAVERAAMNSRIMAT